MASEKKKHKYGQNPHEHAHVKSVMGKQKKRVDRETRAGVVEHAGVRESSKPVTVDGSSSRSRSMQWLLGNSMSTAEFFDTHWEKKPLVVKRGIADYYGKLFDRELLLSVLETQKIDFGAGLTIAKHDPKSAGKAASGGADWHGELPPSLHPTGRATPHQVKQLFASGHTAQVFATQKKCVQVERLCQVLEGELMSLVGATAYLTPPHSQGIAPHHDDVEVFILQTQGSKSWQLFPPLRPLSHKYERHPQVFSASRF